MAERLAPLAAALIWRWRLGDSIDMLELQDLLEKHGLIEQIAATEADCSDGWAQEFGVEIGELIYKLTPLGREVEHETVT